MISDILARIKEERLKQKISQEQMGAALGVSTSSYSELERGVRKLSVDDMITISNRLNIDIVYLLSGEIDDIDIDDSKKWIFASMADEGLITAIVNELSAWLFDDTILLGDGTEDEKEMLKKLSLRKMTGILSDFMSKLKNRGMEV